MPHICPVCKCHCECGGDNKDDVNRGELSRCYCCQGFEGGGCDDEEEPGIDDMPEFIPSGEGVAYRRDNGHGLQADYRG